MTVSASDTATLQHQQRRLDAPPGGRAFGWPYWMCNTIEMFERLAYFGIRSVVPIYIMQATEPGGLHMTAVHKGWVYMWWAIFQSWLPMFTGGFADRYGYKRILAMAISMNAVGYVMMALFHEYYGFFAGILVLAFGTAFFKPALQGSIAQNLTKANSSMGWGIFYWVVNVGAVCAPVLATVILGKPHSAEGWRNLFLASAAYTCVNLLVLLTFRDVPSGADKSLGLVRVFWVTVENISFFWFKGGSFHWPRGLAGIILGLAGIGVLVAEPFPQLGVLQPTLAVVLCAAGILLPLWFRGGQFAWQIRLPAFLLIMSCFWMMMYQLWDLHPNFIEDWIDSSSVAKYAPTDSWREYGDRGLVRVPQQILLNLNALLIVLLVMPVSYLVRRMRTLSAMLVGMGVATAGILVAGLTGNGWILLLGIVFFSFGEMLTGPKKNEYLGLIAPPGKKGLYLGYVNIPVGVGVGLGSIIAGVVYDNYGEKATLALKHLGADPALVERAARSVDWSDSLEFVPDLAGIERSTAFEVAAHELGQDRDAAARTLRRFFRYDHGQVINLALQFLALEDGFRQQVADYLHESVDEPDARDLVEDLRAGQAGPGGIGPARFVHLLPEAMGTKRQEVFDVVVKQVNGDRDAGAKLDHSQVVDLLWDRFSDDRETLNNLAMEYIAQATDRVSRAVGQMTFDDPVEELERHVGLGRTKSFAALSAARGASQEEVENALRAMDVRTDDLNERAYCYVICLPHRRFMAVAGKNWSDDHTLLEELVRSDDRALAIVRAEIDETSTWERVAGTIKGIFIEPEPGAAPTAEGIDYRKLASKHDLIHKALSERDWSDSSELAARLLRLNPFEARTVVAAEISDSPQQTTRMLWDRYRPQYKVWTPFALIGVLATIALAIFGQMAKRWADMNA